ncbi:hypothetical protein [Methylopila sp. 73B]|uniref:hypothetical protein n=1 Tax=Methylopila sp. 73B TaxID=1120792 RepID=UPI0012DCAD3C|nr:hypothetical protein [Methylopila sp. 73B]
MIFGTKTYDGFIYRSESRIPINFDVCIKDDLTIKISDVTVPLVAYIALDGGNQVPGSKVERLRLEGTSPDGYYFTSDYVTIRGSKIGTPDSSIQVEAHKATLCYSHESGTDLPVMRLWLVGLRSFPNIPVSTPLGELSIFGSSDSVTPATAIGCIEIIGNIISDAWLRDCDNFLTFIHKCIEFGHGSRLHCTAREVTSPSKLEITFYSGKKFPRSLPVIHPMNQQPFIDKISSRYFVDRPFPEPLWTAISWLQNESTFLEGTYLASMTALESLCDSLSPRPKTKIIQEELFLEIKKNFTDSLLSYGLNKDQKNALRERINNLNSRSLVLKISALRDYYGLSKSLFNHEKIVSSIRIRNKIVHLGTNAEKMDLWDHYIFIREMICQIVMCELDYSGPYEKYEGGYSSNQFMDKRSHDEMG